MILLAIILPVRCLPSENNKLFVGAFMDYVFERQYFTRNNKRIIQSDIAIVNTKTGKRIKLDGFLLGFNKVYLGGSEVLMVNTLAGAHTHIIYFYAISKNGDLSLVDGGAIGSDAGEPSIYIGNFPNDVIISTYHSVDEKQCRTFLQDTYRYENNKFVRIAHDVVLKKECVDIYNFK